MKSYSSREIIKILKEDGWFEVSKEGSHLQLKHLIKKGRVTVTHPVKDVPDGTTRSIFKQAGLTLE
jgi:predicted RNA binding protein YcfA (HicA-like mRNA interferase family)